MSKYTHTSFRSRGAIRREWYDETRLKGDHADVESWFSSATGKPCETDGTYSIWAGDHWLSQAEIDEACRKIDDKE